MDNVPKCKDCKWFLASEVASDVGECRRFPPIGKAFASVFHLNWCGEFQAGGLRVKPGHEIAAQLRQKPGDRWTLECQCGYVVEGLAYEEAKSKMDEHWREVGSE